MSARSGLRCRRRPPSASDLQMAPVFGLYTHIRSNMIRSALLLAALMATSFPLAFGLAMLWTGLHSLAPDASGGPGVEDLIDRAWLNAQAFTPWFIAAMLVWICVAMSFARKIIDRATGASTLAPDQLAYVHGLVEPLCIARGLRTPVLNKIEDSAPNAFSSGFDQDNAAITLTSGLLDLLDRDELETVLAHELTHIRNGDVTLIYTATVIGGWIEFSGDIIRRNVNLALDLALPDRREKQGPAGTVVMALGAAIMILAATLSRIFRLAISRRREFLADAGAVELTKNPDALIRALLKLETAGRLDQAPSAIQQMCFCHPVDGLSGLFSTHPPVAERIDALVRHAGGRLPQSAPPPAAIAAGPWSHSQKKQA